jgi:hypothetical protein
LERNLLESAELDRKKTSPLRKSFLANRKTKNRKTKKARPKMEKTEKQNEKPGLKAKKGGWAILPPRCFGSL